MEKKTLLFSRFLKYHSSRACIVRHWLAGPQELGAGPERRLFVSGRSPVWFGKSSVKMGCQTEWCLFQNAASRLVQTWGFNGIHMFWFEKILMSARLKFGFHCRQTTYVPCLLSMVAMSPHRSLNSTSNHSNDIKTSQCLQLLYSLWLSNFQKTLGPTSGAPRFRNDPMAFPSCQKNFGLRPSHMVTSIRPWEVKPRVKIVCLGIVC